jgi:hypothetical protein
MKIEVPDDFPMVDFTAALSAAGFYLENTRYGVIVRRTPPTFRPPPKELNRWQSMDTAPTDGTVIIGRGKDFWDSNNTMVTQMKFHNGMWWRDNNGYGYTIGFHPTDWMPL